ncbi:MAG: hypothetical protein IKG21_13095 [Atopobiaceae bacterium]|nr:hypothetical protein [Atopobiaceae bacterium]
MSDWVSAKVVFARVVGDMLIDHGIDFDHLPYSDVSALIDQLVSEWFRPTYDEFLMLAERMVAGTEDAESRRDRTRALLMMQMRGLR